MDPETREPNKSALVLGYGRHETRLFEILESFDFVVAHSRDPVGSVEDFDLVVSFGFKHIIKPMTINSARRPIINLHISYLPFNRGMHPIFWSFFYGTPNGVTIHEINEELDTGAILKRELVNLRDADMTFREAHALLIQKIETLFEESVLDIMQGKIKATPQEFRSRVNSARDLPTGFRGWDENILQEISRLRKERA